MFHRRFQNVLRLFLAVLVAAVTTAPPVYGHAHAEGNLPHCHDDFHGHEHVEGTDSHHHDDHVQAHVAAIDCLTAAEPHYHVCFLGVTMSLPAPSAPEEGKARSTSATVVQMLGPNVCAHVSAPAEAKAFQPILIETASAMPSLESTHCGISAPVSVAPLCDIARHERSGVQVI